MTTKRDVSGIGASAGKSPLRDLGVIHSAGIHSRELARGFSPQNSLISITSPSSILRPDSSYIRRRLLFLFRRPKIDSTQHNKGSGIFQSGSGAGEKQNIPDEGQRRL